MKLILLYSGLVYSFYQYLLVIMLFGGDTIITYSINVSLNAISSVIIVGAIIALAGSTENIFQTSNIFGFLAIILAAVNIFGGFLVTQRMLQMYKKKKNKMSANLSALFYLISGILFILALRGLSSPKLLEKLFWNCWNGYFYNSNIFNNWKF